MQLKIKSSILLLLIPVFLYCQKDETLFSINNKKISKSEFIESFSKNNPVNISENKDSARKYLDQYIELKLKVAEAEFQGIDKSEEFKDEFERYRKQLAQPYLIDQELVNKLAKESYERLKTEIRARHILVSIDPNASPKDTIIAYQKAMKILKRLIGGEDFETVAKLVSDDPQAINNGGDLWYIGPFEVPYKLENYLYSTNHPKFSNPVRTQFGYHIVEILDKRNNPGRYKVAHIMISLPADTNKIIQEKVKQLADSIYSLAISGQDFSQLALKYSSDNGTSVNGGEIPWFEPGTMPHEFELSCYKLKTDGAISKPVKTRYGWHIIKRIGQKNIPDYEQIEEQLKQKVSVGERGDIAVQKTIERIKSENQFTDYNVLSSVIEIADSTVFNAEWKIPEGLDLSIPIFTFDNQTITALDFAKYIESKQQKMYPIPVENYIYSQYNEFVKETLISYEELMLEKKYKKYKNLISEFRDGILYFDIMQKEVWDKIANDKNGLEDYYNKNKNAYNNLYLADVSIFGYSLQDPAKIEKQFRKLLEQNTSDSDIVIKINSSIDNNFKLLQHTKELEGINPLVDQCIKKYRSGEINSSEKLFVIEDTKMLVWFNNNIQNDEKSLEDIKGIVTADYQKYIERLWISELKKKFKVEINESVFESIFK